MKITLKITKGDKQVIDSEMVLKPVDSSLMVWKDSINGIRIVDTENELENIAKRHKNETEFFDLHLFSDDYFTGKLLFINAIEIISINN